MDKSELIGAGIRSIAASFPVASSIAQAWSEYKSYKERSRIESFMAEFHGHIKNISVTKNIDPAICENAAELLEQCVEVAVKEPSEKKRNIIALLASKLVINSESLSYDDKVDSIQLVEFLHHSDLELLKRFYPNKNIRVEHIGGFQSISTKEKKEEFGKLIFSLSKLESRGLIAESNDNQMSSVWDGDRDHWENRWKLKHYEILPVGKRLIETLEKG